MKRVWAFLFALATLSCPQSVFAQTNEALIKYYAPADEYFGPLQMSILGIRNQIEEMSTSYDAAPEQADAIMGKASMTEAALRDWENKYPHDPALAQYVYRLCKLYEKIDLETARKKSLDVHMWLFSRYAETSYARDELKSMEGQAQGEKQR